MFPDHKLILCLLHLELCFVFWRNHRTQQRSTPRNPREIFAPVSLAVRQAAAHRGREETLQTRHCADVEASRAVCARHRAKYLPAARPKEAAVETSQFEGSNAAGAGERDRRSEEISSCSAKPQRSTSNLVIFFSRVLVVDTLTLPRHPSRKQRCPEPFDR